MHDKYKISIIVPVYNVEKYLKRCLDSIINQTYKNIEIIIINDCTPDNSQAIIDFYKRQDSRIVAIKHEQNKGLGGARNTGIENATGDYIAFVDSDDWIETNTYEKIIFEMKEKKPDIIKFGRFQEYKTYQTKLTPRLDKEFYKNGWESLREAITQGKGRVSACDNVYRLGFVKDNSLFFKEKLVYEDAYFTIRAQILAKGILIIDDFFYHYVKDDMEDTITNTVKQRDAEVLVTIKLLDDFLKEVKREDILVSDEYHLLIFKWVTHHVIYRYQEVGGDVKIKKQVMQNILNDMYFRNHLSSIVKSNLSFKYKILAWMLLNIYSVFKISMRGWYKLKKIRRLL